MTLTEFQQWLFNTEPRGRVIYHVGHLVCDRVHDPVLHAVANFAYEAQACGFVELAQIRWGEGLYAYLAIRTNEIVG